MEVSGKLTNVQIELLKLFQYDLPEKQLTEIKNMLAKYFAQTATNAMDELWGDNNWSNDTMKQWADEDLRSKQVHDYCFGHQRPVGFYTFKINL